MARPILFGATLARHNFPRQKLSTRSPAAPDQGRVLQGRGWSLYHDDADDRSGVHRCRVPNGDFLWALKNVPAGFEFSLLSSSSVVLTCTEDRVSSAVSAVTSLRPRFRISAMGQRRFSHNAAFWKLLIGPMFVEQPWTVVISQPKSDALASAPQSLKLSARDAACLVDCSVRKHGAGSPHADSSGAVAGRHGQDRLRRFESRVEVHSDDEFEVPATSFNTMAAQVGPAVPHAEDDKRDPLKPSLPPWTASHRGRRT